MSSSPFTIGVVASCLKMPDPAAAVAAAKQLELDCLQVPHRRPDGYSVEQWAEVWLGASGAANIAIASTVTGFPQENYSSIQTIGQSGGLVPDEAAESNVARVLDAIRFTALLGVDLLTFHAGFIPEDASSPTFAKLLDRLGRCADAAAAQQVRIGLESGQESAGALKQFLTALGRVNVGCNFDPANMILYGRQEPLAAVEVLAPLIFQVHAKDGTWSDEPGVKWGKEVPLGQGAVDFNKFVPRLRQVGFAGSLIIEREAGEKRLEEIGQAARLLRSLQ